LGSIEKSIKIAPLYQIHIEPLFISTVIMAIDHTTVTVPEDKFRECLGFYVKALEPLGYRVVYEFGDSIVGLGSESDAVENYKVADFWLIGAKETAKAHIAFRAESKFHSY
jgi:4-hydroxyphenylpyruvate dioxygenase-like putative hemolysin